MQTLSVSLINVFLASIFQIGIIYKIGVGLDSDIYYSAILVSNIFYTVIFGPLNNVLIPMFLGKANGKPDAGLFWNTLILVIGIGFISMGMIYLPFLILYPLIFKSISAGNIYNIGKIFLVYSTYNIFFSALCVKNCFLIASGRPLFGQFNILLGWLISLSLLFVVDPTENLHKIAGCLLVGSIGGLFVPNFKAGHIQFKMKNFISDTKKLMERTKSLIFGGSVFKTELLFDGAIASFCGMGSLTIFYFLQRMMSLITNVVNSGYIQPITIKLSDLALGTNLMFLKKELKKSSFRALLISFGFFGLIMVLLKILGYFKIEFFNPYVNIFEENLVIFLLLIGYLFGSIFCKVYATGFYVLKKEFIFLKISTTAFIFGVFFKILGAYFFKLSGLSLGTSMYWVLYSCFLFVSFLSLLENKNPNSVNMVAKKI